MRRNYIVESLYDMYGLYDLGDAIDWLSEHETAYADACRFFNVPDGEPLEEYVTEDELVDWISEHDTLYDDFQRFFKG